MTTRMTTREMIEVLEAIERGEDVQYAAFGSTTWFDAIGCGARIIPDFIHAKYRAKPNPREFWVNVYRKTESLYLHTTRAGADNNGSGRIECIHVREVIE